MAPARAHQNEQWAFLAPLWGNSRSRLTAKAAGATLSWTNQDHRAARAQRPGCPKTSAARLRCDNYSPPVNFGYAPRESSPRFEAAPTRPTVSATVKWYNPEKGFGF